MTNFDVHRPAKQAELPFIVHVPHSSVNVPARYRADFAVADEELASELLAMTDRYTDEFAHAATQLGGTAFVNRLSRLVMDPERFRDESLEPMARRGMGAIYVSRRDGRPLRRSDFSTEDRRHLIAELYDPYHHALEELVCEHLDKHDCCLIVDLHSFPKQPLSYEDASLQRPHVCIGFDEVHVNAGLRDRWSAQIRERGLEVAFNSPFAGSLVPSRFYQRDRRVRSLMIEIRRDLYMDETNGQKTARFDASLSLVTTLLATAAERARALCLRHAEAKC